MEEKIIIKSEKPNIKLISIIILILGVLTFIAVWASETSSGFYADCIERAKKKDNWDYVLTSMVPYFASITILPFAAIAGVFYAWSSSISLTVTDKRIYGKAAFGKRVDLPLDMISSVGTGMINSIAVATSSGAIKFSMLVNKDAIHNEISKLLLERQDKRNQNSETIVKQTIPQSNADELKKYKDLLDSGVISQEEFDAKKKQLLGL